MMVLPVKTRRVRKKKPQLFRGMTKYFILAIIIFGSAFITVKQRNMVTKMGYKLGKLQENSDALEQQRNFLKDQFNKLKQPDDIIREIDKHGLNLVNTEASQKISLHKPEPIDINNPESNNSGTKREYNEESRFVRN